MSSAPPASARRAKDPAMRMIELFRLHFLPLAFGLTVAGAACLAVLVLQNLPTS